MSRYTRHLVFVALALAWPLAGSAEEGGSGHYMPGTISSFVDGVSPTKVTIARVSGLNYQGSIGANRALPIAGETALDVDVNSQALGLTGFWRPSWGQIGEHLSYGMSATVPFVRVDVAANVEVPGLGRTIRRRDTETGLGDLLLTPLMLNYHVNDDLNLNGRLNILAPTGSYEVGRLANLGKNYWTLEPILGFMYLGQQNGHEASIFFGADFNTENTDTSYQTGTQLHVDGTLAQHFPLLGNLLGAGVTGYWYQQVEGDSGSGATFGPFKARTNGLGPTVSLVREMGAHKLLVELKGVKEFAARNRPEGSSIIMKAMLTF
jgi:hypothetical protein